MKKKRFLSFILSLVMVFGAFVYLPTITLPATAASNTFNASDTTPVISTAADLTAFNTAVTGGNTFAGKTVKLAANVTAANGFTGIGYAGDNGKPFSGNFDGQGYTITATESATNPDGDRGIFNFVRVPEGGSVTIKNLKTAGTWTFTISTNGKGYVGGLISCVDAGTTGSGGTLNVTNCWSSVKIVQNGSAYGAGWGGLIGFTRHASGLKPLTINIDSCVWDGCVDGSGSSSYVDYSGGLVGYTGNNNAGRTLNINITNSVSAGSYKFNSASADDTGLFIGYMKGSASSNATAKVTVTISNCISCGSMSSTTTTGSGKWLGHFGGINGTTTVTCSNFYYTTDTFTKIASTSTLCNAGTPGGTLTSKTAAQVASLSYSSAFSDVYKWYSTNNTFTRPDSTTVTAPVPRLPRIYFVSRSALLNTSSSSYSIGTADELADLAVIVNTGANIFGNKTVNVTADINISAGDWVAIGNASYPFSGNFNGQGHVISNLHQYRGGTIGGNVGLFGSVSAPAGKTTYIRNFKLTHGTGNGKTGIYGNNGGSDVGTVISAVRPVSGGTITVNISGVWSTVDFAAANATMSGVGGILGSIAYLSATSTKTTVNVSDCRYSGTLTSPTNGANKFGGIVGWTREPASSKVLNVTNCLMDGTIIINSSSTDDCGGIVGFFKGTNSANSATVSGSIQNCIFAGVFQHPNIASPNSGYIVGEVSVNAAITPNITIQNNYYRTDGHTNAPANWHGYPSNTGNLTAANNTSRTLAQIKALYCSTAGSLSEPVAWYFNAGNAVPIPSRLYGLFVAGTYSNSFMDVYDTQTTAYSISNAAGMVKLQNSVNDFGLTFSSKNVNVTTDITLPATWRSIGTRGSGDNIRPFRGTFNGQNHTITLASTAAAQSEGGLFGYVDATSSGTATIQNVRLTGRIDISSDRGTCFYGSVIGCVGKSTVNVTNVWSDVDFYTNAHWFQASGGFIGGINNNTTTTLTCTDCIYSGNIWANADVQNSGGFIGYTGQNNSGTKTITFLRCVFAGLFQTNTTTGYYNHTGTFAGYVPNASSGKMYFTATDCLVTGRIAFLANASELNASSGKMVGVVIGSAEAGGSAASYTMNNVYFLNTSNFYDGSAVPTIGAGTITSGAAKIVMPSELASMSLDHFTGDATKWTLVNNSGRTLNYPVPKALKDAYSYSKSTTSDAPITVAKQTGVKSGTMLYTVRFYQNEGSLGITNVGWANANCGVFVMTRAAYQALSGRDYASVAAAATKTVPAAKYTGSGGAGDPYVMQVGLCNYSGNSGKQGTDYIVIAYANGVILDGYAASYTNP